MSFDYGLEKDDCCYKFKRAWILTIYDVCADGVQSLPPSKSARPNINFKTMEIISLNENITRPTRPDWKPLNLVLFDIKKNNHPVFEWIKKIYDPENDAKWSPPDDLIKSQARLQLFSTCGDVIETWVYENVWPESADFSELDMSSGEILYCNLSLRYDRAWIENS